MIAVTVLYTCFGCGLKDAPLDVAARGPEEDIESFVARLQVVIGRDHARRCALCASDVCDVKIPVAPGSSRAGASAMH